MKSLEDIRQFQQFDNIEFIAKQVVEGFITGLHRSPFHGFSVEFAEHRIYNPGESLKFVDWKLYARTEKMFVKRFEEETNLRSQIIIDTSSSMLFPYHEKKLQSKLAFSIYSAAALIYMLRQQRDAVGLTLFSDDIEMQTKAKISSVHAQALFTELQRLLTRESELLKAKEAPPEKATYAAKLLHLIAENTHRRSLVMLFTDLMDTSNREELFSALQHLRYCKHEVVLFHTIDKSKEEDFDYNNRPYRFVDMENGEEIKFNPNALRADYVRSIQDYYQEVKLKCGQFDIDFVEADINKEFHQVLLPYMIKRQRLM